MIFRNRRGKKNAMFGNAFKQLSPLLQDLFEVYLIFFQPH